MKPWVLVSLGYGRAGNDGAEYQRAQEESALSAGARLGIEVRIAFGEGDANRQVKQILDAVAEPERSRPAAVLASTVSVAGFERVARTALAAGVGWVLVDNVRPLTSLQAEFAGRLVSWVSVDYVEVGRLSARMAVALLPNGGKILSVEGPDTAAAALQRRRGQEQVYRGTKIECVGSIVADWKPAGAAKATQAWLEGSGASAPKPDLIVSHNDEMAESALRIIRAARPAWAKVPAIGCDGLPSCGQRLVREGTLRATIVNPAATGPAVELVAAWQRGEKVEPIMVPVHAFPPLEQLSARPIT